MNKLHQMKHGIFFLIMMLVSVFTYGQCNYTLELYDYAGNGWQNGSQITITIANGAPISYTLNNNPGNYTSYSLTVNDLDSITIDYTEDSVNPSENYYLIIDSEGNTVIDSGNSPLSNTQNITAICPGCNAPFDLEKMVALDSSVHINWSSSNNSSLYEVIYSNNIGFDPDVSGTTINVITTQSEITNLTSQTTYEFYVRSDCGIDGFSDWEGPLQITTSCDAIIGPYIQTFDTLNVPNCLDLFSDGNMNWSVDNANSFDNSECSLIPTDNSDNSGHFIWLDHSGDSNRVTLSLPVIDISSITNPVLSFDYWMCSSGYAPLNELIVEIWGGTNWVLLDTITASDSSWGDNLIGLSSFNLGSDLVKIRFTGVSGGASNDFIGDQAIDNIKIEEAPICQSPHALTSTNETLTTTNITWQDNAFSTEWELEWGPYGYTQGDSNVNSVVTGITVESFNITGLSPSSTYDVYVRATCPTGGFSEWWGPYTFDTLCGELIAPFTETFLRVNETPNCWSTYATTGNTWLFGPGNGFNVSACPTAPTDHSENNSNFAWVDHSGTNNGVVLETPVINVSGLNQPALEFYFWMCSSGYNPSNELHIESIDSSGNWNLVEVINTGSAEWTKYSIVLTNYIYNSQLLKLRFRSESGGSIASYFGDMALDDISIKEAPTCLPLENFNFTNISRNGIQFSFSDVNTTSPLNYEIEYATTGTIMSAGAGQGTTTVSNNTNQININNLVADTEYEVFLRANCGNGDFSEWIGPFRAITSCDPFTAPYFKGFESDIINEINNCETGIINSTSNDSIIFVDDNEAATGTSHILMDSGSDPNSTLFYITPMFSDLDSNKQVRFNVNDKDNGGLEVGIITNLNDINTFTPFATFTDVDLTDDAYQEITVDFSAYNGGAAHIAFKFNPVGTFDKLLLDDIHYEEAPNCIAPSNISNLDITQNSVNLSWSPGNNETEWTLEYGLPGFTPGGTNSIGVVIGISDNSNYQLNGLIPNTEYEAYLYSVCSSTIISSASAVHRFRTFPEGPSGINCTTPFNGSLIYRESFENGTPVGWTGTTFTGNADDWMITSGNQNSIETGPFQSHEGSFHLEFQSGTNSNGSAVAISPLIDLTQGSGDAELSFFLHAYGADMGNIEISASTISNTGPFTTIFNFNGEIQENDSSLWAPIGVDLSAYQGQQIWIEFKSTSSGNGFKGDFAIDEIEINACGNFCEAPDSVEFSFITDTTAQISWQDNTATNNWEIAILNSGSNPPSGPGQSINTTPYVATNLTANTSYDVYIRTGCYGNNFSSWSMATSFTTLCNPQTAPYSQDFESFAPVTSATPSSSDLIENSNCWNTTNNSLGWIIASPALSATSNTGPNPQINTGNYMMIEGSLLAQVPNRFSTLESPLIDLTNLTVPELKFDYHAYGADIGSLEILVRSNNQESSLVTITGQQQSSDNDSYIEEVIDLSPYSGQIIQIIFKVTSFTGGFECDVAIDNFEIRETIVCNAISNLNATTINTNSAIIGWIDNANAIVWDIEVQLAGNPQSFTPSVFSGSSNAVSTSINGLNANSSYDIYVRADCGSGTYADWVGPLNITTLCDIITAPYIGANNPGNNFETNLGDCWEEGENTLIQTGPNGINGAWTLDNFANTGTNMGARINIYGTTPINDWLVTPKIDLGTSTFEVIFDIAHTAFGNTTPTVFGADDQVRFLITDDNGITWDTLNIWDASTNVSPTGETVIVDLSAYSGLVQMAFWGTNGTVGGGDTDFFVDNFSVDAVGSSQEDVFSSNLLWYPNPVQNNIHLESNLGIKDVKVFNTLGQQMLHQKVDQNKIDLDLTQLQSGIYFFQISLSTGQELIKVIKE